MEHAKKMILIPQESIEDEQRRLQHTGSGGSGGGIGGDIQNINKLHNDICTTEVKELVI